MTRSVSLLFISMSCLLAQNTTLPNNVAPWLSQATKGARANGNARVLVTAYLKLSNEATLQKLVRDIYTPGSAQYRRFLTPAQFRAAYSPASTDLASVQSFLSQKGLKVEFTPANRMYVDA